MIEMKEEILVGEFIIWMEISSYYIEQQIVPKVCLFSQEQFLLLSPEQFEKCIELYNKWKEYNNEQKKLPQITSSDYSDPKDINTKRGENL